MTKWSSVVVAITMLTMVMLGVAHAHWSDVLDINGTLQTGTEDVKFTECWVSEFDPCGVGERSAYITVDQDGNPDDKIHVSITNAYPGYRPIIHFNIGNVGTIPAKLDRIIWTTPLPAWASADYSFPDRLAVGEVKEGFINFQFTQDTPQGVTVEFEMKVTYTQCSP